ncbi:MAG TPA: 3'-5' exonuclease [Bacteroidales bacterium]|nr:MAG: ATP-dependent DNA helicase PcrA [Bacteroidetes bacterium ADurb.Bin217]HPM12594.1 3'-5' exonuclease [Bacteroidales bacterium]
MQELLDGLNESQKQAVLNTHGPTLVIAGAGSGKTRVLTFRIAYLLSQGVPSYKILALTFTNKAANEMKERIISLVGPDKARDLWMGTFHSVFSKILRYESQALGFNSNFTIYDTQDSKSLITKIINDLQLDKEHYKPGMIYSIISKAKNDMITPDAYIQDKEIQKQDYYKKVPQTGIIYKNYVGRCRQANAMDFDDLLLYTNYLFHSNQEILHKYQQRFEFILVDEFQDTNKSQHSIVRKLGFPQHNVCVVGDDAQSIYSFRGAKIENILNFSKEYPTSNIFKLEQNYRSTQTIVNAANSIIQKNKNQIPKKTFSELEQGNLITVLHSQTDIEEGVVVCREINELTRYNSNYNDIAILYRTNAQSRIFEEVLRKYNIPYKIYGGLSFFQRKEIKDILSYFRTIINPRDEEAISRIINYPARGIGQTTIEKITQLALRNNISLWDVIQHIEKASDILQKGTISKIVSFRTIIEACIADLQTADAYSLASRIIEQSGIFADLKADTSIEGKSRFENLQALLNGIKEFVEQETEEIYLPNYIEKIALLTDIDSDETEKQNKITLMTIHSAKGLEFEHCFLVGLEEGLFPSTMNNSSEYDVEEERRLFYVALTRAKQSATISYATSRRKWGNLDTCKPSRFIQEIDTKYIKNSGNSGFTNQNYSFLNKDAFQKKQQTPQSFGSFKKPTQGIKIPVDPTFIADNPEHIEAGQTIIHASFGKGIVKEIIGKYPDSVAHIQFTAAGEKKLLLKFAKLKVLE